MKFAILRLSLIGVMCMDRLRLEQRPELRQVLTPKLIATLKLLILPKLELQAKLEQELEENPMLEVVEPERDSPGASSVDEELGEWRKFVDGMRLASSQIEERDPDEENPDPMTFTPYHKTLYEDLIEQLAAAADDERIRKIGEYIIGNLDDRGLLPLDIPEIVEDLKNRGEIVPPPDEAEVERALKVVQSLSPAGIAARSIKECLLLQLEDLGLADTVAYRLIADHYDLMLKKNVPQLAKVLGVSEEEINAAMEIISHLTFYPAEGRETNIGTIEPDLIVYKDENGRWRIIYNDENIPELRINRRYQKLLSRAEELTPEAKQFLLRKLESARWWIDALRQRRENLIKTMRAIIKYQDEFFERGPEFIKPLKMETIADEVGVHPATISRIVRDKFVLTPFGTFPMRKFFTQGLSSAAGGEIATDRVRRRIKEIIAAEDPKKPLSDEKIAKILQDEGIKIARRTVAKYREQMGILPARMRKK